ncbi:DUF6220 domain-containing protein [Paenibacillus aurantiacus]|uniref:DUF6220 domain-containing protein n=1 Tax=Paenibacillus aurantiacus TaxID=1936118 RepID=A0ABV5KH64_9BACL
MSEFASARIIRRCFVGCAWLFAAAIALQVLIAGLALFVDSANWAAHISFARYFGLLPLVMIALAWIGRFPSKTVLKSVGLFGMIIGMFLTAIFSSRIGGLSALHPVIALMLFWSSMDTIRTIRSAKPIMRK